MRAIIKALTVITLIIIGLQYYPYLKPSYITAFVENNNMAAPVVFVLICAARPVLFFLPSMGLTIVAGVLFGAVWGALYVALGGALSTIVGYYFASWLGRDAVKRMARLNDYVERLDRWSRKYGKNAVLSMRLFNLPWDLVSYWAGLTGIPFKEFYIMSMIPLLPISFLYTYFGSKVFDPKSAGFIISLSIMFILGALPYVKSKWEKRRSE